MAKSPLTGRWTSAGRARCLWRSRCGRPAPWRASRSGARFRSLFRASIAATRYQKDQETDATSSHRRPSRLQALAGDHPATSTRTYPLLALPSRVTALQRRSLLSAHRCFLDRAPQRPLSRTGSRRSRGLSALSDRPLRHRLSRDANRLGLWKLLSLARCARGSRRDFVRGLRHRGARWLRHLGRRHFGSCRRSDARCRGAALGPSALSSQLCISQHLAEGFLSLRHQLNVRDTALAQCLVLFCSINRQRRGRVHFQEGEEYDGLVRELQI